MLYPFSVVCPLTEGTGGWLSGFSRLTFPPMATGAELSGPDFAVGISLAELEEEEPLLGHFQGEPVILVRRGEQVFAVGARCSHYGGPLERGLVVEDTVRCPLHHSAFSLKTGEAIRAPALRDIPRYAVEVKEGQVVVLRKMAPARQRPKPSRSVPRVVIVGGGAAGEAAAEMLRRKGHTGEIELITASTHLPYDRPNLSKDYLAGEAPQEWMPLREPAFYKRQRIQVRTEAKAVDLHPEQRHLTLYDGQRIHYDALLLATGASPISLDIPGAQLPHVHLLRYWTDSDALIAASQQVDRVVVIGASFIGLETAASLRHRGLEVDVVAPDSLPLEKVMGKELGTFIQGLHQERGVRFHLGTTPKEITPQAVTLANGEVLPAQLVVMGVGVRPNLELAQCAGLKMDHGVLVDAYLRTSAPDIWAAGDLARWPDPHSGDAIRVEHWVVAGRMGQTAARNILGADERFEAVPFFWSKHYDLAIQYVGHVDGYDHVEVDGQLSSKHARVTYWKEGRPLAVATVGRHMESLHAELERELELLRRPGLEERPSP